MSLINDSHQKELREAAWHSRGYLQHFDGRAIPQFITLHLADSIPREVIEGWQRELSRLEEKPEQIVLQRRIERYLPVKSLGGYATCSSAVRMACADCQRCAGSLTSARSIISHSWAGNLGSRWDNGMVGCSNIALMVSAMLVFLPTFNATWPVSKL